MMLVHALFAALAVASPPDTLLSADSLLAELRKGGYTMVWRHGATDRSVQEPMGYQNTPRFQQRNLTDAGITDAKMVGLIFKAANVPIGDVLSSPMFRTRETAEYAFGRVTDTPILRQVDPSPEQRQFIAVAPAAGTNRVLVTHHFVIERYVPGVQPGAVGEGEAVVVRANGRDSVRLIGIFKMADWQRLASKIPASTAAGAGGHGAPPPGTLVPGNAPGVTTLKLVIPPSLQTPERAAVAEYFRVFNGGDAAKMRQFYERSVVPNPERTMEQRMEVYGRIKQQLGSMSIVSVEAGDAGKVVVKADTGAGAPATITFGVESRSPYRLTTISFQMMQDRPPG